MKQYTKPFFIIVVVGFVLLGIYLKDSGILLLDSTKVNKIGSVKNCIPANDVCDVEFNGKIIGFHLPNDVAYLQDFPVEIHLKGFDKQKIKKVQVDFLMPRMNMGINRIQLEKQNEQIWSGTAKLAVCLSGRADWLAKVIINLDGKIYQADFLFNIAINN